MALRCPPQNCNYVLMAGDPTVSSPPFPLLPFTCGATRRCRSPRDFTAPHTYGGSFLHQAEPEPAPALPAVALTWSYVKVLSCTCHVACGDLGPPQLPSEPREVPGPALTLGMLRQRLQRISVVNEGKITQTYRGCLVSADQIFSAVDHSHPGRAAGPRRCMPQRRDLGCRDRAKVRCSNSRNQSRATRPSKAASCSDRPASDRPAMVMALWRRCLVTTVRCSRATSPSGVPGSPATCGDSGRPSAPPTATGHRAFVAVGPVVRWFSGDGVRIRRRCVRWLLCGAGSGRARPGARRPGRGG